MRLFAFLFFFFFLFYARPVLSLRMLSTSLIQHKSTSSCTMVADVIFITYPKSLLVLVFPFRYHVLSQVSKNLKPAVIKHTANI
ncbi:hypothetical protein B0T20DRAFT_210479 [Sordaria brevicollis]|uniref:Secreted protein n=1 Tax=Sordaria brevicollis TaxID=83679 RepID=A0AAE0PEH1_SORBR|nr:hypothetical protein B0T20DRAFT_210479 [Sordaria brevicollis]